MPEVRLLRQTSERIKKRNVKKQALANCGVSFHDWEVARHRNVFRDGKFKLDHWLRALWEYVLERRNEQRRVSGSVSGHILFPVPRGGDGV